MREERRRKKERNKRKHGVTWSGWGEPRKGCCEEQSEVRRNAVTVDRGPVLVQVLQSPTGTTKNEQNENRAAPLRVHASARSMMRICSRHSPMTYRCWPNGFLSFSKTDLYVQLSDTGRRFTWSSSRHTNHLPLRPFYSTILSSVSWPCLRLNIQLDGILIVSWIAQMTKKNELLGTKRWCLEIARDDCFFLCFYVSPSFFLRALIVPITNNTNAFNVYENIAIRSK